MSEIKIRSEAFDTLLGSALFTTGCGILYVMPVYSAAVAVLLHLSSQQTGLLDGLETASLGVASILIGLAPGLLRPRLLIISALICACGNLLVGFMPDFRSLMQLRVLTGLFGEGPLYAYSFVVLSALRRPERGFGIALTIVSLVTALATAPLAWTDWAGSGASLVVFGVLAMPTVLLLAWATLEVPPGPAAAVALSGSSSRMTGLRPFARLLLAQATWFMAPGLFWAFAVQAAQQAGAGSYAIDEAVSFAWIIGIGGSVLPVLFSGRLDYRVGIVAATCGLCISVFLLPLARHPGMLLASFSGFILFWNVAGVYQPALISSVDRNGQASMLVPAAQLGGMAVGSALGGAAVGWLGLGSLPELCAGLALIATPLFLRRV